MGSARKAAPPKWAKKKAPETAEVKPRSSPGKHPGGRPPKFRPEFIETAKRLCEVMSATDFEVAQVLGVTARTVNRWKLDFPEFHAALAMGKDSADERVKRALYHRAVGYTHEEEEIFVAFGKVTRVKTVKHYPPDTKAALSWLENRKRADWARNPKPEGDESESATPVKVTVEVKDARRG